MFSFKMASYFNLWLPIFLSGPITSWQIDGETVETVTDYFGGSKITADGHCSHEIKRRLLLGSIPRVPQMCQSIPEKPVFPALP